MKYQFLILLFVSLAIKLNAQDKEEIIFRDKKSTATLKYSQIYNNPDTLPRFYGSLSPGYLSNYNPLKDNGSYSIFINLGYVVNNELSFDFKVFTPIPEDLIALNEFDYGQPLYKGILHYDITSHYNILHNNMKRYKKEVIKETGNMYTNIVTRYYAKVPVVHRNNLSVDFGFNKFNFYNSSIISKVENPVDVFYFKVIGNTAFYNAKIGVSFLRTESRKYKVKNGLENVIAKHKRLYSYLSYVINTKYDVVTYERRKVGYEELNKNIKQDFNNNNLNPTINPIGFRIGFENKYFFPAKVNIYTTIGFEIGYIPTIQFQGKSKSNPLLWSVNFGLGLFDKLK